MALDPKRIGATYRLRVPAALAESRARALALEQSIEMDAAAVGDARVLRDVVARVESLEVHNDHAMVELSLAAETVGSDAGQLMNMLFGNCSLQPDVELMAVALPPELAATFGGPRHGIAGLRALVRVPDRPLTCTALKPIGCDVATLRALAGTFAQAGLDVIKDDHGWAAEASVPFADRVAVCQAAVATANARRASSVAQTLYAPSVSGSLDQMRQQLELAARAGVRLALIAPMVCGVATFNTLVREFPQMAFLAHPALAGLRIAPEALLGTLFRCFGADAVIFPNHGGRFSYTRAACLALADRLREPLLGMRETLPAPAGGMSVERTDEIVADYGRDTLLLIGGSLLAAREKLYERSCAFVDAVAARAEVLPA